MAYPSVNQLLHGYPRERLDAPLESPQELRDLVKHYCEVLYAKEMVEARLERLNGCAAMNSMPDFLEGVHDDNAPGCFTVECYGRVECDGDTVKFVSQEQVEMEGSNAFTL